MTMPFARHVLRGARWSALGRAACLFAVLLPVAVHAGISLRDDRGAALALAAPPQRIVSLLPSITESVCALGACARLVGTDRFSNWPVSVLRLPKLGGLDDAQIEGIVALKPDVVLVSASARLADRLEALGLKVLVLESRDHADVKRTLALLAQMLGTPAQAERVAAAIERETRAAVERVPAVMHGKRVYFEVDATPFAAGPGSFIGETLARLGVVNAVPAELGPFPKLNPEYVVRLQPDLVMANDRNLVDMARRPGWAALRALRDGQSCGFTSERYELLIRPGPRMGEAAGVLADCLMAIAAKAPAARPSAASTPAASTIADKAR
jgi:iron complex transport system substrate-binding protein